MGWLLAGPATDSLVATPPITADAVNLGGPDDGQKANEIRPDIIEDDNEGQGEEAQAH
jgi:hypothetical protein